MLTNLGRAVNRLPVEPQFALCLLYAYEYKVESKLATLISILSSESIFSVVSKDDEKF